MKNLCILVFFFVFLQNSGQANAYMLVKSAPSMLIDGMLIKKTCILHYRKNSLFFPLEWVLIWSGCLFEGGYYLGGYGSCYSCTTQTMYRLFSELWGQRELNGNRLRNTGYGEYGYAWCLFTTTSWSPAYGLLSPISLYAMNEKRVNVGRGCDSSHVHTWAW